MTLDALNHNNSRCSKFRAVVLSDMSVVTVDRVGQLAIKAAFLLQRASSPLTKTPANVIDHHRLHISPVSGLSVHQYTSHYPAYV